MIGEWSTGKEWGANEADSYSQNKSNLGGRADGNSYKYNGDPRQSHEIGYERCLE